MGYKLEPRTALLSFEDYAGAEVRVTLDRPLAHFLEAQKLQLANDVPALCHFMASVLVEWNLEDDKGAIPATEKGLLRIYPAFFNALIKAWLEAQVTLPAPLAEASKDGDS